MMTNEINVRNCKFGSIIKKEQKKFYLQKKTSIFYCWVVVSSNGRFTLEIKIPLENMWKSTD